MTLQHGGNILTKWKNLSIRKPGETQEQKRKYNKRERKRAEKETKVEIIDIIKDKGR